jgi:hypothetical protein
MATEMHRALTTTDNPYSPFSHYKDWDAFDQAAGHNTAALLARVALTSDELSDSDVDDALDDAMITVLWMNDNGLYELVQASDFPESGIRR